MSQDPENDAAAPAVSVEPGGLKEHEIFWRDHQEWLQECGYALRTRYQPEWAPSWRGTKMDYLECEDGAYPLNPYILDAVRISDGKMVSLKKILSSVHPFEVEIAQFFSSDPLILEARNHCVRILDVLTVPAKEDTVIVVMPFLRNFQNPRFQTVGEVVELLQQLFDGLQFIHQNHVAHRDISRLNVMMDPIPMFPEMYHPIRTELKRDFSGRVKRYQHTDDNPDELPIIGGDRSVPEFQGEGALRPRNPFHTDIYCLGNLVKMSFLQKYYGLEFMDALVRDMTQEDPKARPNIDETLARFAQIRAPLTKWHLRRRLTRKKDPPIVRFIIHLVHVFRTARYFVKRLPPVPTPTAVPSVEMPAASSPMSKTSRQTSSPAVNAVLSPVATETAHSSPVTDVSPSSMPEATSSSAPAHTN